MRLTLSGPPDLMGQDQIVMTHGRRARGAVETRRKEPGFGGEGFPELSLEGFDRRTREEEDSGSRGPTGRDSPEAGDQNSALCARMGLST